MDIEVYLLYLRSRQRKSHLPWVSRCFIMTTGAIFEVRIGLAFKSGIEYIIAPGE